MGQKDPLENEMATHCKYSCVGNPRTKEPGGLQSMGLQRVERDWAHTETTYISIYKSVTH